MQKFSITSLVKEAQRELAMRKEVFPRRVSMGKMRQGEMDMLIAMQQQIIDTLVFCERNEADIRAFIEAKRVSA